MKLVNSWKPVCMVVIAYVFAVCMMPSSAWATVEEGDQSQPTDEEIAAAIAQGLISTEPVESSTESVDSLPYVALGAQIQHHRGHALHEQNVANQPEIHVNILHFGNIIISGRLCFIVKRSGNFPDIFL